MSKKEGWGEVVGSAFLLASQFQHNFFQSIYSHLFKVKYSGMREFRRIDSWKGIAFSGKFKLEAWPKE